MPNIADPTIAACAGPPEKRPVAANANFNSTSPAPEVCKTAPKRMKIRTTLPTTSTGRPKTPSVEYHKFSATLTQSSPAPKTLFGAIT